MDVAEKEPLAEPVPASAADVPLVVDLDGALLKTELRYEALFLSFATHPLAALRASARLADAVPVDLHDLPASEAVLDLIRAAKAAGRRVYLVSAADRRSVEAFAGRMGCFDGVCACDGVEGGGTRERSLVALFGAGGFDYVGHSMDDLPVWRAARTAYAVNASGAVLRAARGASADLRVVESRTAGVGDYLRAMRLHQWAKNLLILVPGLAAHVVSADAFGHAVLAFFSFSLCASSVYLLNDLLDLRSDRRHASKRLRPFASGTVPLSHGVALFPVLLLASLAVGLMLSPAFVAVLTGYYALTLAYSLALKRHLVIDVVTLSLLYGARLVAGGVAFGVVLSEWLITFSIFLFLSLALVKRVAELIGLRRQGEGQGRGEDGGGDAPAGRAYTLDDLPVLEMLAASSGFVSVLVLALYINSPDVVILYRHPKLLWCGGLVLIYWLCRILLLTHRGQMSDDPVIHAVTDPVSLLCGGLLVLTLVGAAL